MKKLEDNFVGTGEVRGHTFNKLDESPNAYIYEVKSDNIRYEIFKKKINERFDCESYPKSNSFGIWAWTTRDFDKAMKIFLNL